MRPFGYDDGPKFPYYPLDYNAFHIQRIKDIIAGKDTPHLGNYSHKTADKLRNIRDSLCEIQWEGKEPFNIEYFDFRQIYFTKEVQTLKDAKMWVVCAEQYLTEHNTILKSKPTKGEQE